MKRTIGLALVASAMLALAVPSYASAFTKRQANRAVVAKAKRIYAKQMRIDAYADCRKVSRTRFTCEYGASLAPGAGFKCGFDQGVSGRGSVRDCPIGWIGTAKVTVYGGGPIVSLGRLRKLYL